MTSTAPPTDQAERRFRTQQASISRRRHDVFVDGIAGFRAAAGLRRWVPHWYPVTVPYFGHGSTWGARRSRYRSNPEGPAIGYLDHEAFLATRGGRLAVVLSWPYQPAGTLRDYAAAALPGPRFVTGVDAAGVDTDDRSERTPAGIYGSAAACGWIVTDAATLGDDVAVSLVREFLAGGLGLAAAVDRQRELDVEHAAMWAEREAAGAAATGGPVAGGAR